MRVEGVALTVATFADSGRWVVAGSTGASCRGGRELDRSSTHTACMNMASRALIADGSRGCAVVG